MFAVLTYFIAGIQWFILGSDGHNLALITRNISCIIKFGEYFVDHLHRRDQYIHQADIPESMKKLLFDISLTMDRFRHTPDIPFIYNPFLKWFIVKICLKTLD